MNWFITSILILEREMEKHCPSHQRQEAEGGAIQPDLIQAQKERMRFFNHLRQHKTCKCS